MTYKAKKYLLCGPLLFFFFKYLPTLGLESYILGETVDRETDFEPESGSPPPSRGLPKSERLHYQFPPPVFLEFEAQK